MEEYKVGCASITPKLLDIKTGEVLWLSYSTEENFPGVWALNDDSALECNNLETVTDGPNGDLAGPLIYWGELLPLYIGDSTYDMGFLVQVRNDPQMIGNHLISVRESDSYAWL